MPGRHYGPCASCGTWCAWVATWQRSLLGSPLAIAAVFTTLATRRLRLFFLRRLGRSGREVEDFAPVDPHLDTDDAVGGLGFGGAVVDIRAQGMQRDATFTAPLGAGDLGAVQTTGNVDLDAQGAKAHGVADRALHCTAEHDAALELLGDRLGHQLGVQFGLAHFGHVDVGGNTHHRGDFLAQLLDVLALLADHHARTGGVDRHAGGLGRTLDLDLADAGLSQLLAKHFTDLEIGREILGVVALVGVPLGVPVLGNAEADTGGMYFMTHRLFPQSVADDNGDMRGALKDARTTTLGAGKHALHGRTLVDEDAGHAKLVHIRAEVVLGIGDSRQQHLANQVGGFLVGKGEHVAGLAHGESADQVSHQASLLRRNTGAPEDCFGFGAHHLPFLSPEWPLNVRVTANSPSLCPTMFSLINTGTCWRPLWMAMVSPTISGRIIERRDQVLIGRLLLAATEASTFFTRSRSTNGPLFSERGILDIRYLRRRTMNCWVRLLLRVL